MRKIRSFVLRKGRITKNQEKSIIKYWPTIGIDYKKNKINFDDLFNRKTKTILEIGFGMGLSLVNTAYKNKKNNFIGIEVYQPGIGSCLSYAHKLGITNLRIINYDAVEVLENMIYDESIDKIQLFFPDPWDKKKHHKRRIIQLKFVFLIYKKLKLGSIIHIVTDSENYKKHILNILKNLKCFKYLHEGLEYKKIFNSRPMTKFEIKGIEIGNKINDLIFKKIY